ncbi:MAG: DUF2806 domain-containing protein [Erysipelotrichaceae bacterium]|nr:DUF2806 domain-containing protein [Erysipelotrichaceae bacterium]
MDKIINILNIITSLNTIKNQDPYANLEKEALDMYIEDIKKSNLSEESKLISVLTAKQYIKKLKNQVDIADKALELAKPGTDFSENSKVNGDWLNRFMDSAGYVSDEDVQLIWGKILAREFEEPGTTPLYMIRVLSELTTSYAKAFNTLCSMSFGFVELDVDDNIKSSNREVIVTYVNNEEYFKQLGLSFNVLNELETLGLIKFDSTAEYKSSIKNTDDLLLYINGQTYEVLSDDNKNIYVGNVILTSAGKYLNSIIESPFIGSYYPIVEEYLSKNGIHFKESFKYKIIDENNIVQVIKL